LVTSFPVKDALCSRRFQQISPYTNYRYLDGEVPKIEYRDRCLNGAVMLLPVFNALVANSEFLLFMRRRKTSEPDEHFIKKANINVSFIKCSQSLHGTV
jgi:hypothetical protein